MQGRPQQMEVSGRGHMLPGERTSRSVCKNLTFCICCTGTTDDRRMGLCRVSSTHRSCTST